MVKQRQQKIKTKNYLQKSKKQQKLKIHNQ